MPGVHKVNDINFRFVDMFTMQASSVLLERAFPGDRHSQNQCVQWRMVETFTLERFLFSYAHFRVALFCSLPFKGRVRVGMGLCLLCAIKPKPL